MYTLLLTASPRPEGNTNSLAKAVAAEMQKQGTEVETVNLYDMDIKPCRACRICQKNLEEPACILDDEMQELFPKVMRADLIVLATPVYCWFCTPPMKSFLDRCVYALNKYYGDPDGEFERGPSIWSGKSVALVTSCGYPPEKGADLLDEGIRRYCRHSGLDYLGMLAEHHMGYDRPFMDSEKEKRAADFAEKLIVDVKQKNT